MSKLIGETHPENLRDIADEADCCMEVCFTTSHRRELKGWARNLIITALKAQARSSDKEWVGLLKQHERIGSEVPTMNLPNHTYFALPTELWQALKKKVEEEN